MNTTDQITQFWHRRSMLAMLCLAFVMVCFGTAQYFAPDTDMLKFMSIPLPTLPFYGLTAVLCIVGVLVKNHSATKLLSFMTYLTLVGAVGVGIFLSDSLETSLVALWALLALASGFWQAGGVFAVLAAAASLGAALFLTDRVGSDHTVLLGTVFLLPPIISAAVLRRRHAQKSDEDAAYHELANELSTVASQSEIVINAIGDGVIATDKKGIIRLINPAAETIIGLGRQDTVDLEYRSVFKLSDAKFELVPDENNPIQKVLSGDESIATNELTLTSNAGRKMNISLLVSPLGKPSSGAIIVFRDITAEISESNQRAEFVSTASHEMRTPVAAIEGYLGLALNPATAQIDDKARIYLTKAHESAQHLGRLFQDLLDVSKADDGRLKNDPSVIDLVAFSRDSVTILNQKAVDKGVALIFKPDTSDETVNTLVPALYVEVDPDHMREVLSNLIDNAIKYTKEGTVTVDVTATVDTVLLSISDSGIGIAREDIPHLFQKFYRIDNTDTREIGGTGLGLYLCRRLVESMNGRIWVESEHGKGSTFFVELSRLTHEEVEKRRSQKIIVPNQNAY